MDPLNFKEYLVYKFDKEFEHEKEKYIIKDLDLFKSDIFSLGITLLEIASGKAINLLNSSPEG